MSLINKNAYYEPHLNDQGKDSVARGLRTSNGPRHSLGMGRFWSTFETSILL